MPDISRQLPSLEPDGLVAPDVGTWGEEKYLRVWMYDEIFARGMKNKWATRTYIDLFAGSGRATIRGTQRIVPGSPLLALDIPDPFDRYIFCEADPEKLDALRKRVARQWPAADVRFVAGDVNTSVHEILSHVPRAENLSFCFVDPYSLNIRFETLRDLASGRPMDFLILLALAMDAQRNEVGYVRQESSKLDLFLGSPEWRARWNAEKSRAGRSEGRFMRFLAEEYIRSMESIGYGKTTPESMYVVRRDGTVPLYHLAFFSKHQLGYDFWSKVLRHSTAQRGLFD